MRPTRDNDNDADLSGQDSFLDIVANIVGILILLVVVVGVRAAQHVSQSNDDRNVPASVDPQSAVTQEEVKQAVEQAMASQSDVRDIIQRVASVRRETILKDAERVALNTAVVEAEAEIERRRAKLSSEEQRDYDLRRKINEAQATLDKLTRQQVAFISQPPEVEELENLPTPLARTQSGEEVSLRLADGHVAFIPREALIQAFQDDVEENAWRLRDRDEMINTVGPFNGFRIRYRIQKQVLMVRRSDGSVGRAGVPQFLYYELLPESPKMGEPVSQAIESGSQLMQLLKSYRPEVTTITIWSYPDSFREYQMLKAKFYELGYGVAGRPLIDGVLIGGSPYGSRSAVQ